MCCTAFSLAATRNESNTDYGAETIVATPLPDGYWIEAFPFKPGDTPDIIAYGLGFLGKPSAIKLFTNPVNNLSSGWKVNEIANLDFPLWDAQTNNGGRIRWLRNPGDRDDPAAWEARDIGNSTGMHRVNAPVLVFTPVYGSDPTQGPTSWTKDVAFDSEFRLIHDVTVLSNTNEDLDMVLVAGREGIVLLWFDKVSQTWKYNIVGEGLPQSGNNPYWGSGSVVVCRVGDDEIGYIATCEAFHGNVVSVYVKKSGAPTGAEALKDRNYWERVVVDDFGALNDQYTGTLHHVVAVQVESESTLQSFAIACMGAPIGTPENQGVYTYTPVDITTGEFKRAKITDQSAGRISVANFSPSTGQVCNRTLVCQSSSCLGNRSQKLDIASISYYVPGYFTGLDPPNVRINTLGSRSLEISALRLDKEVLLLIPPPS
ncbi:hypothetical protein C0992_007506, partial [Termitomyces sp. T32_za158]